MQPQAESGVTLAVAGAFTEDLNFSVALSNLKWHCQCQCPWQLSCQPDTASASASGPGIMAACPVIEPARGPALTGMPMMIATATGSEPCLGLSEDRRARPNGARRRRRRRLGRPGRQ